MLECHKNAIVLLTVLAVHVYYRLDFWPLLLLPKLGIDSYK